MGWEKIIANGQYPFLNFFFGMSLGSIFQSKRNVSQGEAGKSNAVIQHSFVNSGGICSQIVLWYGRYFPVPSRMVSSLSDQDRLKARPVLKSMMILGLPCKMDSEGRMPYSVPQLKLVAAGLRRPMPVLSKPWQVIALPRTPVWLPHTVETTFVSKECNVLLSWVQKNSYFSW